MKKVPADPGDAGAGRLGDVALGERPQGVELGPQVAGLAAHPGVGPGPGAPGQGHRGRQELDGLEQVADEGGAPLEAEGDHGHPPAVVLVADPVGHRDPDLVEEELGELGGPGDGGERPDLHAGRVHGQDEPRDAPVAAVLGAGAHQQLAVVGHLGVGSPDLRSGDHVVVAVPDGPGAQRGEVAPGIGLGEALAPDLVAPEDGRQVARPLLGGALGDDGRPGVEETDEVDPDVGGVGPLELLFEDQLLDRRRAAAAALDRPVDPGVAGVEEQPLPVGVVGAAPRPVVRATACGGSPGRVSASHRRSSSRNACSASV